MQAVIEGTAIFKEPTNGRDVVIFVDQVVAVSVLPNFKSTVVIGPGSTAIPVTGTVEEVASKIAAIKQQLTAKGEK